MNETSKGEKPITIKKSIQLTPDQDKQIALLYRMEMIQAMETIGLENGANLSIREVDDALPTQQKILEKVIEAGLVSLLGEATAK
tara:strand:+ start:3065 stop:3319 length:255 start_codon:yes stop_codon:yes gene_type:complete